MIKNVKFRLSICSTK